MTHRAHSKLPSEWIAAWFQIDRSQETPYGISDHSELDRPANSAELIAEMIHRSKTTETRLARLLSAVGWMSSARLMPPQTVQDQLGDFGEVFTIGLLETLKEVYVPLVKLRYQMDRDQSLHGTDVVGLVFDPNDDLKILALDFCEVKVSTSTKHNAKAAVGKAHTQLADDRKIHFTDTLELLAERLDDIDEDLATAFVAYLASREDGPGGSNRIVLLIDADVYDDIVFENIPAPPDLQEPLEFELVRIDGLKALVDDTWPLVATLAEAAAKALVEGGEADASQ